MDEIEISQDYFTLIPSRFPPVNVYERLENVTQDECAALEKLTNPRLKELGRLNAISSENGTEAPYQNWNHAPFAYRNPDGSSFFDSEIPALELSSDLQTALSISVKKRERFLASTSEFPMYVEMRVLTRRVTGRFADFSKTGPFQDLSERRKKAQIVLERNLDGLLYKPTERPSGKAISIVNMKTLEKANQGDHFKYVWDGQRITKVYCFNSGQEIETDQLGEAKDCLAA